MVSSGEFMPFFFFGALPRKRESCFPPCAPRKIAVRFPAGLRRRDSAAAPYPREIEASRPQTVFHRARRRGRCAHDPRLQPAPRGLSRWKASPRPSLSARQFPDPRTRMGKRMRQAHRKPAPHYSRIRGKVPLRLVPTALQGYPVPRGRRRRLRESDGLPDATLALPAGPRSGGAGLFPGQKRRRNQTRIPFHLCPNVPARSSAALALAEAKSPRLHSQLKFFLPRSLNRLSSWRRFCCSGGIVPRRGSALAKPSFSAMGIRFGERSGEAIVCSHPRATRQSARAAHSDEQSQTGFLPAGGAARARPTHASRLGERCARQFQPPLRVLPAAHLVLPVAPHRARVHDAPEALTMPGSARRAIRAPSPRTALSWCFHFAGVSVCFKELSKFPEFQPGAPR